MGSSSRCSESVCPRPWMIPPSTWLDAPSGLMTRPTSWIAAIRSTRTSPVSTSTATSATWTPKVRIAHPGRVRAAGALAEDLTVLEQAGDLLERPRAAVGGDDVAVLEAQHPLLEVVALRRDLDHLARRVRSGRAHRRAHARGRGGAGRVGGVRAARRSRRSEISTRSNGSPSSSAAIWASAVDVPVPMSWWP